MKRTNRTQLLFRNDQSTPLGHISLAGTTHKLERTGFRSMRVLGSYALVYLMEGEGHFRDAQGFSQKLCAGDLMILFPEIAHRYGPERGQTWSEIYVVFNGPAFDLWRECGVLQAASPVLHLTPVEKWCRQLESVLKRPQELESVAAFLHLLTKMLASQVLPPRQNAEEAWLRRARGALEANLSESLRMSEVARIAGLSHESFRKRFAQETDSAPAHYRAQKRIEAAQVLLAQTNLTMRAIADNLGFSDEFHFARRFKQMTGKTPRAFRLSAAKENGI